MIDSTAGDCSVQRHAPEILSATHWILTACGRKSRRLTGTRVDPRRSVRRRLRPCTGPSAQRRRPDQSDAAEYSETRPVSAAALAVCGRHLPIAARRPGRTARREPQHPRPVARAPLGSGPRRRAGGSGPRGRPWSVGRPGRIRSRRPLAGKGGSSGQLSAARPGQGAARRACPTAPPLPLPPPTRSIRTAAGGGRGNRVALGPRRLLQTFLMRPASCAANTRPS